MTMSPKVSFARRPWLRARERDRPAKDLPSKPVQADEIALSKNSATGTVATRIGGSANRMKRLYT